MPIFAAVSTSWTWAQRSASCRVAGWIRDGDLHRPYDGMGGQAVEVSVGGIEFALPVARCGVFTTMTDESHDHNVMLAIFSVASGMVGVCLTGIGLLNVANTLHRLSTVADELLAVDATLFLGCCLCAFLSFRVRTGPAHRRLRQAGDGLFFIGLLLMVVVCTMITSFLF